MEDVWFVKQCWIWLLSHKLTSSTLTCVNVLHWVCVSIREHWPLLCHACNRFGRFLFTLLFYWKDCVFNGIRSLVGLQSAALLVIMWSCFISLTSISCLLYVLISLAAAGAAVQCLGYTPGLFIVGIFAILILWMYANFWITGTLFIVGGYLFSLNHARLVVLMATLYSIYCVKVRIGWFGPFLSVNLAFLSNDAFNYLLQWCDKLNESTRFEEHKASEAFTEDNFSGECEYSIPSEESEEQSSSTSTVKNPSKATSQTASKTTIKTSALKSQKEPSPSHVIREDKNSLSEMRRILSCADHYEALGFPRHKKVDAVLLKKEYRKKAMLLHPDKNMGSPLASDSFKKLQCAYEVLSDSTKKRDYDEQLRKEENKSISQKSPSTSKQETREYFTEESRRIQCTKCGNSHIWICTNRCKAKARWCQDCCQYHQAKDGDGWVEYKGSLVFNVPQKMEIPRAFVCAESKIFDVSEWAICQGMACRPNTHRPSFHVNMVGLEKTSRSKSSRFPWGLDAETEEDEEEFEMWLQQAVASGLFSETSKRRKTWSPFKLNQSKKQWRRSSSGLT
ncbi:hypothetical protein RND81_12G241000 [Saponaria officinalis]|uniref:J domain-containing protein n=1 Tax=Saponaria officinalis TaxID=3572 RepID=A0AAW1HET2_SAPOF